MKYERLTGRNEEPFYAFDACKECEHKDGCDNTRLHELEDEIETLLSKLETAKKIIYQLRNLSHVGHLRSELDWLCRVYCIEENKE